ncbi:hypothetical protein RIF29_15222 [Crotalaria pallida]|uniref:Leucine-rich repeat-containing N-terminal plant-type domain-containing protein n=1 Tax=Crotalaria pallida TaxID=3830 RepID=A0AAN9FEJ0_CROPI
MMAFTMFLLYTFSQTLMYMPSATFAQALSSNNTDKLALLALKEKLTNGIPDSLPSWNDSLPLCKWQGVTCSSSNHMRVSILQLENQNWGGTLGASIGNLTFLKTLNLSNINLHGGIPREVGGLKRLQLLDLSHNNLQGEIPIELANCSNLQVISLIYNNLTGNVPSWFGSMIQLTQLLLGANNLVGTIPPSFGNLSLLVELSLGRNHLEGSIPDALEYAAGGHVSPQGDIYSYGILVLEMLTGKRPTDSMFGEGLNLHNYCKMAIPERITEIVDSCLLIPSTEEQKSVTQHVMENNIIECVVSLARIGVACSQEFPAQRMGIKDVITEFHAMKQMLLNTWYRPGSAAVEN